MADFVAATLAKAGYKDGDPLVVGVSGGPDSLALLHKLLHLLGSSCLHVAHLDHAIRTRSAADAQFVANVVDEWGVAFHLHRIDVPLLARRGGFSLEEGSRRARYEFLAEIARITGAHIVTVGHNLEDQAETILLHLLRGSGLTGLRGMRAVSPLPGAQDLTLVRPLLTQTREQIEAYCIRNGLQPILDESNVDVSFRRNRIRHNLLPDLATYNPQIMSQLVHLAEIAAAEDQVVGGLLDEVWPELIGQRGRGWLSLHRERFRELPLALQRRAVRQAVLTLKEDASDITFKSVEQGVEIAHGEDSGRETMLPGGITMLADYESLLFSLPSAAIPVDLPQIIAEKPVFLPVPGQVALAHDWVLKTQPLERGTIEGLIRKDPWEAVVELRRQDRLFVRGRAAGERMQPLGMNGRSSSLQDIMVNRKMASRLRGKWPIVATDEHIVWLVGQLIDHRARVRDRNHQLVKLSCLRMEGKYA